MSTPILVPLDGSDFAAQVLPLARAVAQRMKAAIHLVSVYQSVVIEAAGLDVPGYDRGFDDEQRAALASRLRATALEMQPALPHGVTHATVDADAVDQAILQEAERIGAGLIVTTTHGRGGLQRAWLGSVADRLVVTSPIPVLLVRPAESGAAGTPSTPAGFRRILVPLDGTPLAEAVLGVAASIAEPDAEYCLLRVVPVPVTRNDPEQAFWTPLELDAIDARRAEATRYLEDQARTLLPAGTTVTVRVALSASPAAAILDAVRSWGADLVAISTHGRSGVARMVAGSVADKVYRGSEVPTLIVRPTS